MKLWGGIGGVFVGAAFNSCSAWDALELPRQVLSVFSCVIGNGGQCFSIRDGRFFAARSVARGVFVLFISGCGSESCAFTCVLWRFLFVEG